jgi:DNA-binding NarL/FixJ family response regulator
LPKRPKKTPEDAGSESTEPIRVVVADDDEVFRHGLAALPKVFPRIVIVGEASDGLEAVDLASDLAPDILLMDVRMPKLSGIEATSRIRDEVPTTRILMLTVSDDEEDLFQALKAGAVGYLLKGADLGEVKAAIEAVYQGESFVSPQMATKLIAEFTYLTKEQESRRPKITRREREVLQCLAKGMSNKKIAEELYISENTVKNHVRNILEKLQLNSRIEAATYAIQQNLGQAR